MKLEKYFLNNKNIKKWLIFVSLLIIVVSCTVTPVIPERDTISFDGNEQNSGFLYFLADGSGIITTNASNRYNSLISKYSTNFIPPLAINHGLIYTNIQGTNLVIITKEGLVNFGKMNSWRKRGL